MSTALPVGQGLDHTRLYDHQWRLLWDSATDTTPAYRHISDWANATIDRADGSRWAGQFYRCPEGIKRFSQADLTYLTTWPNPTLELS